MEEELIDVSGPGAVLVGAPGTGKTRTLLRIFEDEAGKNGSEAWASVLLLTPDRRRATQLEKLLPADILGAVAKVGGHRLVRSINSYAYLVISEWMIGRKQPFPKPALVSGAEEDVWLAQWLADNGQVWDGIVPDAAKETEWFRTEIRELMSRVGEAGLNAEDLDSLGRWAGIPAWQAAARMYESFAGKDPFSVQTPHIDAARVQIIAARVLQEWQQKAEAESVLGILPIPTTVLVDDLQDCTVATAVLLQAMARLGTRVVATASPLSATASYRGGRADLGKEVASLCGIPMRNLTRYHRYRSDRAYSVSQAMAHALDPRTPPPASDPQRVGVFSSEGRLLLAISNEIRRRHFLDEVPWHRNAIIVRHSGQIETIRRALVRHGVPVAAAERPIKLSQIPVCAAILRVLYVDEDDSAANALELLTSPLVGADTLRLYAFIRSAAAIDESWGTLEYWLTQSHIPDELTEEHPVAASWLRNAAAIVAAGKAAATMSASDGLWAVWEATGKAEAWREIALSGADSGREADLRLDAVVALFRSADLWMQEEMAAGRASDAQTFAKEVLGQVVERDSLAVRGMRAPGVEVLTVAQAAGREWDFVYIVGLQDGLWPASGTSGILMQMPKLRTLLDEARNVGVGAIDPQLVAADTQYATERREQTRSEAMLLVGAASRARLETKIMTVVDSEQALSSFVMLLKRKGVLTWDEVGDNNPVPHDPKIPFDLESVVALLRQRTMGGQYDADQQVEAARALAYLADSGVQSADPVTWIGAGELSSREPVGQGKPIGLSPSKLETASQCLLNWFFHSIQARRQQGVFAPAEVDSAQLGTLIHRVAEEAPHGTPEQLRSLLDQYWESDGTWLDKVQHEKALHMVSLLGDYFQRPVTRVEVEKEFRLEVGDATIYGRVDRLEHLEDGRMQVVDIKTGKTKPRPADVEENLQLAAYQLAMTDAENSAGAVYLSVGAPGRGQNPEFRQPTLDVQQREELQNTLADLSANMRGPDYRPTVCDACRYCDFRDVCPARKDS